mgnify:CR=1 FL=1
MSEELPKGYDPHGVETKWRKHWRDEKTFTPDPDAPGDPYSIVIPPPNVTGALHIGHALNLTLIDSLCRHYRQKGRNVLWVPGTDHAGIATQIVVERQLDAQNISRHDLGREKFLDKVWEWKDEYASTIKQQWGKMGLSVDYSRERFTLDEGLSKAVRKVFVELYKKGWIYRGEFIINWDPKARTALSDIEVIHKDVEGAFYHMNYMLEDGSRALEVATTRPETMFGDTAVAVNPNDDRYKDLIGKNVILPILNKPIPIVGDEHADPEFGTGVVKITPAHDPNDFLVGQRHNLPQVNVMNDDGTMNELAGEFNGMDRFEARKAVVKKLEEIGALVEIEKMTHSVGHSERTGVPVEPRLSTQWFVKMDQLAKNAIANQDTDDKVDFYPPRFNDTFLQWMENVHDWVISRQRAWGVPLPIFYAEDKTPIMTEETIEHVAKLFEEHGSVIWWERDAKDLLPEGFTHPGSPNGEFTKETDIMDVWFDSGSSWNGVVVNRPELTYPADLYLEGSDQYRGWFNSSLITSVANNGVAPYKQLLSQGFALDGKGEKMSKSLGNTIAPSDVEKQFGAEILRLWVTSVDTTNDVRISMDILSQVSESYRKIRNTLRFLIANTSDFNPTTDAVAFEDLRSVDQYMTIRFNQLVKTIRDAYANFEFLTIYKALVNFINVELSAFYLDFAKDVVYIESAESLERRQMQTVFYDILVKITKLLTPILPHTAEEIWSYLEFETEDYVQLSELPEAEDFAGQDALLEKWNAFMDFRSQAQKALEEARNEKVIGKSLEAHLTIYPNAEVKELLEGLNTNLAQLLIVSALTIAEGDAPESAVSFEGVAFTVERAEGDVCDRCRRIDPTTKERSYNATICDHCASIVEENFAEGVAEGFEVKAK